MQNVSIYAPPKKSSAGVNSFTLSFADPQKCENDILKESLIASEHQAPFVPNHELMAVAFQNNSTPFIITHVRQPPTVKITADRRSFLKGIFPPTRLTRRSLTGKMKQNSTHWEVEVTGSVEECPGEFELVVNLSELLVSQSVSLVFE